jgi:hypothetical protein
VQLPLELDGRTVAPADRWASLPESIRQDAMLLLARLISRGVLEPEGPGGGPAADVGADDVEDEDEDEDEDVGRDG